MERKGNFLSKTTIATVLLFIFVTIVASNSFSIRGTVEQALVVPTRSFFLITSPKLEHQDTLKIIALKQQTAQLKKENELLRRQLSFMPEKADLYPVSVIWYDKAELFVYFPYKTAKKLIGKPVVIENIYLGRVKRAGEHLLVIERPESVGFAAQARTESNIKGVAKGEFGEQLIFETARENELKKGELVWYVEAEEGWEFIVGTIKEVEKNERLPIKKAVINYQPESVKLRTVFIVL